MSGCPYTTNVLKHWSCVRGGGGGVGSVLMLTTPRRCVASLFHEGQMKSETHQALSLDADRGAHKGLHCPITAGCENARKYAEIGSQRSLVE